MDARILQIDGWMSNKELGWLHNTAQAMPPASLIVEIGAWKGRSTSALYTGAGQNKAVIAIDTWGGQPDLIYTAHREALEKDIFSIFINNIRSLGIKPKPYKRYALGPQFLIMNSVDASDFFDDNSISFLFIDGDHTNAWKDIVVWYPKVSSEGIISGHDYNWNTVFHAVNNKLGKIDNLVDSIWIKRKG